MSIRTILCLFQGDRQELNALSSACTLAHAHLAQLRILHIAEPPPGGMPIPATVAPAFSVLSDGDHPRLVEASERERTESACHSAAAFAVRHGLRWAEDDITVDPSTPAASYRVRIGSLEGWLAHEAMTCDLVVLSYDNDPHGDFSAVLAGLFHSRRPVLLLPASPGRVLDVNGRPGNILVAWDGRTASANAILASVPFLVHAKRVTLLTLAGPGTTADRATGADMDAYLRSHGVIAERLQLECEKSRQGQTLLDTASSRDADMIVMGAYGTSHLGEMLFGGVSDYVLKHGRFPLLLAR